MRALFISTHPYPPFSSACHTRHVVFSLVCTISIAFQGSREAAEFLHCPLVMAKGDCTRRRAVQLATEARQRADAKEAPGGAEATEAHGLVAKQGWVEADSSASAVAQAEAETESGIGAEAGPHDVTHGTVETGAGGNAVVGDIYTPARKSVVPRLIAYSEAIVRL